MTHRLDEIKAKVKAGVTIENIEGLILRAEESGNINLAYRAAQDLENMEYEIKTQAAELLKLREESVFLNDHEKVTLYVCDECGTISNTAGICIICNESLQEKDYYAKEK